MATFLISDIILFMRVAYIWIRLHNFDKLNVVNFYISSRMCRTLIVHLSLENFNADQKI